MTMGPLNETDADEMDGQRQRGSTSRPQHMNIKDDSSDNAPRTTVKGITPTWQRLLAGGTAGFVESSICHPLDTIKTRMQLQRAAAASTAVLSSSRLGPLGTARHIIQREGPLALYKGLTAVYCGIVPKMAIRFVSFEHYRDVLGGWHSRYSHIDHDTVNNPQASIAGKGAIVATAGAPAPPSPAVTFLAGLLAGLTEAVAIVTPAEVCKIRMQSQNHSLRKPSAAAATAASSNNVKYKNVVQTAALLVKEEGVGALYKGVVPTMLRQGCNQAVNFTAYNWSKKQILGWKRERAREMKDRGERMEVGEEVKLDHWQSLLLGGFSGGMGPLVNNPLDVVKTRMQKQVHQPGKELKYKGLLQSCITIAREEGTAALWKGITPRLMRIMPGQAITFMTYEAVTARLERNAFPINLLIFNK